MTHKKINAFLLLLLLLFFVSCAKDEVILPNNISLPTQSIDVLAYEGIEGLSYIENESLPFENDTALKLKVIGTDYTNLIVPGGAARVFLTFEEGLTSNIVEVLYSIKKDKDKNSLEGYFTQTITPSTLGTSIFIMANPMTTTSKFTVIFAFKDENGIIGEKFELPFEVIETSIGTLQVNLSWLRLDDDLDLYLELPNGNEIFYADRRGLGSKNNPQYNYEFSPSALLNLTSSIRRPSITGRQCDSGLYNENISIPADQLQEGVYTVRANIYKKCFTAYGVNYIVTGRYKDKLIIPFEGANPYLDAFSVGEDTTSNTYGAGKEVMKFELKSINGVLDVVSTQIE